MGKVKLRMNEENKYNVIKDVVLGKTNKNRLYNKYGAWMKIHTPYF